MDLHERGLKNFSSFYCEIKMSIALKCSARHHSKVVSHLQTAGEPPPCFTQFFIFLRSQNCYNLLSNFRKEIIVDLTEYCLHTYKENSYEATNGLPGTPENITEILSIISSDIKYIESRSQLQLVNSPLSETKNNKFNQKSINDIAALIFEVIVSCNRNRQLWSNDESRRGHIRTMTCLYFFGPTYTFIQEPSQGIIAETYSDAKVKLEDAYKKSFNPFFP